MKKIKYLAFASSALVAAPVCAQSKNFEGSNLSLGVGSIQLKESSDSASKNWNTFGNVEFTNFQSLNDSWLLGFGVGYDSGTLDSKEFGSGSQTYDLGGGYSYQSSSSKKIALRNNFSVSVLPGYALNKSSMLFGRVSYNRAKVTSLANSGNIGTVYLGFSEWETDVPCEQVNLCGQSLGSSGSKYLNGVGWGLGLRHKFTENLFLQAEYKYVSYKHNAELDVKPKTQGYTLSIGYKF